MLIFLFVAPQLGLKASPPPIQEKPAKSNKKAPPTKEELCKMTVSYTSCTLVPSCVMFCMYSVQNLMGFFPPFPSPNKGNTTGRLPEQQKC